MHKTKAAPAATFLPKQRKALRVYYTHIRTARWSGGTKGGGGGGGSKHLDSFNELVNEENISPLVRILILLITRRDEFFLLSGEQMARGSSSRIMKRANGNEAVLCQIIL